MDYEEVIERIEYNNSHCDRFEDCKYNAECGECAEALDITIKALEKQIPKEPVAHYIYVGDEAVIDAYNCKNCGTEVGVNYTDGHKKREHHCDCGQAIDWSEVM